METTDFRVKAELRTSDRFRIRPTGIFAQPLSNEKENSQNRIRQTRIARRHRNLDRRAQLDRSPGDLEFDVLEIASLKYKINREFVFHLTRWVRSHRGFERYRRAFDLRCIDVSGSSLGRIDEHQAPSSSVVRSMKA